jgi:5-methylcytosine-specific restriction endonuclease McrA
MKACTVCGEAKPLAEFSKDRSRADGHTHRCKLCDKAKASRWQKGNAEQMSETKRAWRERNAEQHRATKQARHARKRIEDRAVIQAKNQRRRAAMRADMDHFDVALSIAYRLAILKDPCLYCGQVAEVMHTDHYVPVALGGTDRWHNLVRACQSCNAKKGVKCGTWMRLGLVKASVTKGQLTLSA